MMAGSHVILGAAAWMVTARLGGDAVTPISVAAAMAGALLPDLDHPSSWAGRRLWPISKPLSMVLGHRGATHSLLAVLGSLMILNVSTPSSPLSGMIEPITVGYLSHLAGDALTPAGIPLLWPWKRRFGLPICSTGGLLEIILATAAAAGALWLHIKEPLSLAIF